MKAAMIGLGKMGGNMARRLIRDGHQIVGYNRSPELTRELAESEGMQAAFSLDEVLENLTQPKVVWIMIPAGNPTETVIDSLSHLLEDGDIIIDGGNSNYQDSIHRGEKLAKKGVKFIDVGTSGGIWGLSEGYSMMVGGEKDAVKFITPLLETLAPDKEKGWFQYAPL